MAVVARSHAQQTRHSTFPFEHDSDHDDRIQMPFLYPPQLPPLRDSRKAQKMLGLVTDFPRRSATLEVPPRDPKKAQRTLGLVRDSPRDRRSWKPEPSPAYEGSLEDRLAQAERDVRRLSGLDADQDGKIRDTTKDEENKEEEKDHQDQPISATPGWIEIGLEQELEQQQSIRLSSVRVDMPVLHSVPVLHSPEQLSQSSPVELEAAPLHPYDFSTLSPPRPRYGSRPVSFASSHLHNRPTNKIASSRSRGLRANSYPNFSRPLSGIAPTPVPGEEIERDPLYLRYHDDEVGPPTPISPESGNVAVLEGVREAKAQVEEDLKTRKQPGRPKKARWSSLPISLVKFAKRSSRSEDDHSGKGKKKDRADLTEENLQRWEDEVGYVPKMYRLGYDILRSPVEVDMEVERGTPDPVNMKYLPPLPKLEGLSLTPPTSPPIPIKPSSSSSLAVRGAPTLPSISPVSPPSQSFSTLVAQKETAAGRPTSLFTCTICKEADHPSVFPPRRITATCTHATKTCKECIQLWIETCVDTRGWDRVTCPQCGQPMSYEDVRAFADEDLFKRYDDQATLAALSSLPDFFWCQRPGCASGQVHSGAPTDNPVFTCTACGHTHCLIHSTVPYHTGETCVQYDARLALAASADPSASPSLHSKQLLEQEGQKTVQETSKRCPNAMCGWWIQKNEGCDHMTCWKCRFEFCWECGAPFGVIDRKGNKYHRKTCRYWG